MGDPWIFPPFHTESYVVLGFSGFITEQDTRRPFLSFRSTRVHGSTLDARPRPQSTTFYLLWAQSRSRRSHSNNLQQLFCSLSGEHTGERNYAGVRYRIILRKLRIARLVMPWDCCVWVWVSAIFDTLSQAGCSHAIR